jgi:hypothetical protein
MINAVNRTLVVAPIHFLFTGPSLSRAPNDFVGSTGMITSRKDFLIDAVQCLTRHFTHANRKTIG